jgi:hypothetical protein
MRMFIAICVLLSSAATAQNKNCWRVLDDPLPRPVNFWTVHKWEKPPLRTNRQTLRSPWFLIPHALAIVATTVDYRRNRPKDWADAFVPLAVVTAADYGSDRFLWRPFSVAGASYLIVRHTVGAATGNYP